jgi:ABC-type transport system involved in multi-copper enzyme maturation permease subunit
MNSPAAIYVVRWLIRDTFRQARASGLLWVLLALCGVSILFCLSVSVTGGTTRFQPGETREFLPPTELSVQDRRMLERHGVEAPQGELHLLFGAIRVPFQRYREEIVHFLQLLLAGGVADAAGILLLLVWTAGFLPTFLAPSSVSVLLAGPVPRWLLLLGKYLGVLVFVFVQALLFVGGTWLALALKTGVWNPTYLLCVPLLMVHFIVFFSFSLLLAVSLRSTIACVLGSLLFWFVCWGANFGRNLLALGALDGNSGTFHHGAEITYWLLPKPVDLNLILFQSLRAEGYFSQALNPTALAESGALIPALSVLTSVLFAVVLLILSAYQFERTEY